ncbi:hypothetical protein [Legionella maceachernii]|uniref:hypothetical protein n=1 Tax=Legionella maceachernii TaxID=466 RepID=UPI001F30167B|nr:hypothetical protein [Legionella maceachernii]
MKTTLSQKSEATSFNSGQPPVSDKRIDTLFARFNAIYGYLWLSAYNNAKVLDIARLEWSDSLQEFDNQVLKLALEKTKKIQHFPPSLPLFYEYCLTIKKSIQARQDALQKKKEMHTPTDPKIVQLHINKMKESLLSNSKEKQSC